MKEEIHGKRFFRGDSFRNTKRFSFNFGGPAGKLEESCDGGDCEDERVSDSPVGHDPVRGPEG
jgi:hypothetical protein